MFCCINLNISYLVDYFVHDILDYIVLSNENESSKFTKIISKFDIRDAIKEIYEILEDKKSEIDQSRNSNCDAKEPRGVQERYPAANEFLDRIQARLAEVAQNFKENG